MTVPIATSPGRSGFGPHLTLSYNSGFGNGPFGFGWSLSLPAITRKTDKGLPRYQDVADSDTFTLSGAEDLVPVFKQDEHGAWVRDNGSLVIDEHPRGDFMVRRYRPRIEGLFARIERWTRSNNGEVYWRTITKDNVTTYYGKTRESRIADPGDLTRVFSWLISESYDDKGNAIVYKYEPEDSARIFEDPQGQLVALVHERNRRSQGRDGSESITYANRYLKCVKYGNRTPNRDADGNATDPNRLTDWMFEVVFDYGEGHYEPLPASNDGRSFVAVHREAPNGSRWPVRQDPFSAYRAGFEIRTYRLCRRVLMFHHFPEELGTDDYLVRSTEFEYAESPIASAMTRVIQSGYRRQSDGNHHDRYFKRSLPPLEFAYSSLPDLDTLVRQPIEAIDGESLENLPVGIDGGTYQWVDLDGEGLCGILTEQADAWFYKRNTSANNQVPENGSMRTVARFGTAELVATKPTIGLAPGQAQFMDLAGDGQVDVVQTRGPVRGFYERTDDGWAAYQPFTSWPNIDPSDPNLRFVDLTGDGHADILITEDDALIWHPSQAEAGFGSASRVAASLDEEEGPRLIFADGTESIYLADLSGDGLTDLVRIRNGAVCYWPNLGYGRFGAKVAMDNSPWFDHPEQFNQQRIRLADIDGSGVTDIIYLAADGVRIYSNHSGNRWSDAVPMPQIPAIDHLASVQVLDLLGNGTACLVWSSPLPGNGRRPMCYVDLMGGQKPHLLVAVRNNLGAETRVQYAPSTKFYVADRATGKPWITRLPFPVHVVERVETYDHTSRNRFVTRYAYHHGYFDGIEREFHGFGMVEQWDTEEFATLSASDEFSSSDNIDPASHVPPVHTKTWFHPGVYVRRDRVSNFFAGLIDEFDQGEYYREPSLTDTQVRDLLFDDTVLPAGLTIEEEREACRALKGSMLRQEVYALDGTDKEQHPYSVAEQNFAIRLLQPRSGNRHAVFFTYPSEALSYHYERMLVPVLDGQIVDEDMATTNPNVKWLPDPRVSHTLTLEVDDFGNVLKSAAIGYGRRFPDLRLPLGSDRNKQTETLITYTENDVTNPIDDPPNYPDDYRTPLPAETRTFELTGYTPTGTGRRFRHGDFVQPDANDARRLVHVFDAEINYEDQPTGGKQRRLIEQMRTRYRNDDLTGLLPHKKVEPLALPGEHYQLALTPGLLAHVFKRKQTGQPDEDLLPDPARLLEGKGADQGGYVAMEGKWWIPSGRAFFDPDADSTDPVTTATQERSAARQHFYLPRKVVDPFGQSTVVTYDGPADLSAPRYNLLVTGTSDALGNTVTATNDYRALQPRLVTDPNRNRSAAAFDALGMVVATAVMGKEGEDLGDLLEDVDADPSLADLQDFIADPQSQAASLLGKATTRMVYDLDRHQRAGQPPFAATLARETHVHDSGAETKIQINFSYSDGFGREIQQKVQVEAGNAPQRQAPVLLPTGDVRPGDLERDGQGAFVLATTPRRWVGTGRTVFNNKGKPVRQYEPFFSATHLHEPEPEMTDSGVSPILFYDPVERVVAILHPNHTYEKVVFDPWRHVTYDVNDTVAPNGKQTGDPRTDPDIAGYVRDYFETQPGTWQTWYVQRIGSQIGAAERDAAEKAAAHAATPAVAQLDTLGRAFLTLADNGPDPAQPAQHRRDATRVELDIEGNQRAVLDAKDRIVMRYDYDMLGNRIHQASMEAGERWMLSDVAGNPIRAWDSRRYLRRMTYDELRRPTGLYVTENGAERLAERTVYGESQGATKNHRTRVYQVYDGAGVVTSEEYDFKGNLRESQRKLLSDYKQAVNWLQNPATNDGSFIGLTTFDALNRPLTITMPDGSVHHPIFNEANLLDKVDVFVRGAAAATPFVTNIDYDAKGQRERIGYGNGAVTTYEYDPLTFRLIHLKTIRPGNPDATVSQVFQNATVVQDLYYVYDPVGNITRIEDAALKTVFHNGQQVEPAGGFTYDALYRLIEAQGREHIWQTAFDFGPPDGNHRDYPFVGHRAHPNDLQALRTYTERYEYDVVGNVEVVRHLANGSGWTRSYDYEEESLIEASKQNNRLTRTTVGNGLSHSETYSYTNDQGTDVAGCMTAINGMKMIWDFEDQLQQVDLGGGGTAYYVYDAGGQRVRKVIESPNGTRRKERLYLGDFEIYREFHGNGNTVKLERESLQVMDDAQRIALLETQTIEHGNPIPALAPLLRYQLGNHLGSASVELADDGALISYEEYHPYGTTAFQAGRTAAEVSLKRCRYTGKERDQETGLYYHGARYYAPWLGRWVSADPVDLEGGINLYGYGAANPVIFLDPSGNAPKKYKTQRAKDTAAKRKEMEKNLREAKAKGYSPDPMQKRAEKLAKKRGKTPIEQHHHRGVAESAKVKLDPKKMGDPMSSVWSTKKDPVVQGTIGGKPATHHNVAKHLDMVEQAKVPKTPAGLEQASEISKQRLPATVDMTERAKMDWKKTVPAGPPVDPKTGKVLTVGKEVVEKGIKSGGKLARVGKGLAKAGRHFLAAIPGAGIIIGQSSAAYAASQGDYTGAVLDEAGFIPFAGDLLDAFRGGMAVGEVIPEVLPIEEAATKSGKSTEAAAKYLGADEDQARIAGGVGAAAGAVGEFVLWTNPVTAPYKIISSLF